MYHIPYTIHAYDIVREEGSEVRGVSGVKEIFSKDTTRRALFIGISHT